MAEHLGVTALVTGALLVGFAAFLVILARWERARYARLLDALRGDGLEAPPPPWLAHETAGTFRGRRAHLAHVRNGRYGPWTTNLTLLYDGPEGFLLRIEPEGIGSRLAKTFGGEDVELGDPDFDRRMRVRTPDPARAALALDAMLRARLLALDLRMLDADGALVQARLRGRVWGPETVAEALRILDAVAERLEAARDY